jgi:hypothetical protein
MHLENDRVVVGFGSASFSLPLSAWEDRSELYEYVDRSLKSNGQKSMDYDAFIEKAEKLDLLWRARQLQGKWRDEESHH